MQIDHKVKPVEDSEIVYLGNCDSVVRFSFPYVLVACMDMVIGRIKSSMLTFSEIKTCHVHPILCDACVL